MRLEYGFELQECEIPRFAVEAVEGIGKLFTLATLVLNVLATKQKVFGVDGKQGGMQAGMARRWHIDRQA